jgi:hypothetical protein
MIYKYLLTKFHVPGSSGSLDIACIKKVKYTFNTVATLLFYVLQNRIKLRAAYFSTSITIYNFRIPVHAAFFLSHLINLYDRHHVII